MGGLTLTRLDAADLPDLAAALTAAGLPADDIGLPGRMFWAARRDGVPVGYGGVEYSAASPHDGLLRSVVILPARRGLGDGSALIAALTAEARHTLGLCRLWLLTTTADGFFRRLGFVAHDRTAAPAVVTDSAQFSALCPASAVLMARPTDPPSMTNITIYHNPACGTSRNTLALIRNSGVEPEVIEYLLTPPDRATLRDLIARIGTPVRDVIRQKGTPYAELGLDDPAVSEDALIDAMVTHPILINRPIVVTPLGVRLCRPSEAVLDILPDPQQGPFTKEDGEVVIDAAGNRVTPGTGG
ncbi:arsenate reductase (glutaredoxin) [Novispirillum itersonii]